MIDARKAAGDQPVIPLGWRSIGIQDLRRGDVFSDSFVEICRHFLLESPFKRLEFRSLSINANHVVFEFEWLHKDRLGTLRWRLGQGDGFPYADGGAGREGKPYPGARESEQVCNIHERQIKRHPARVCQGSSGGETLPS